MIDKADALKRVSELLAEKAPPGQTWMVAEKHTKETTSAWIFFYNSRQYIETGNVIHALAGNGPVFVNKETGEVQFFGSTPPLEVIVKNYEEQTQGKSLNCAMSFTKQDVLNAIRTLPRSGDFGVAEEFLRYPETAPYDPLIGGKHSRERIMKCSDIAPTWIARLNNSIRTKNKLLGCSDFVRSLNEMPGETRLFSLCFKSQRMIGLFWFLAETDKAVGFVVVEKDG